MSEIRIYTDESVDIAIAEGLQRRGIEAFSARDLNKLGLTDEEQLTFAREEKATIFAQKEFGGQEFKNLGVKFGGQEIWGSDSFVLDIQVNLGVKSSFDFSEYSF